MNIYELFPVLKKYAEKANERFIICVAETINCNFDKLHFTFDKTYFDYKFFPFEFICIAYRKSGHILFLKVSDSILNLDIRVDEKNEDLHN